MAVFRSFAAIALCGMLFVSSCLAAPGAGLAQDPDRELARLAERAYYAPKEVLGAIVAIQGAHAPLPPHRQARVLELLSRARLGTGDTQGALEQAKLLEALGKRTGNASHECLGILQQTYIHFATGEVQTSHLLARRALQFAPSRISPEARVKALLTMAQAHDELRQPAAARENVAEALRIAAIHQDAHLLFLATRLQALRAIAAGDVGPAAASVDRLLALARQSPHRERLVRATDTEADFAAAAGLADRARRAMGDTVRLMKELRLHEAMGYALVNHADFELKSKRFAEAAELSRQALALDAVQRDEPLARTAHFNHALASIYLGRLAEGKKEVEQMFAASRRRTDNLEYLPEYIAALSQAGDTDGAVKAGVLFGSIEAEQALQRAQERDAAQVRIASLAAENRLRAVEASNARARRDMWQALALGAALAVMGMLLLYWRLRASKRMVDATNRRLDIASNRDFLTGLFNRRYIENAALGLSSGHAAGSGPVPAEGLVMLIDIDHFKQINDTHGHAVGDQVLKTVAERLSAVLRHDGLLARWGGEEFLAILPGAGAGASASVAARVLQALSCGPVMAGNAAIAVTGSLGICRLQLAFTDRAASWDEVLHLADEALYMAKQAGRNRACAVTGAPGAASADLARGLRVNSDAGKLALLAVLP